MANVKKNAKTSNTFLSQIFFPGPACSFVIVGVFGSSRQKATNKARRRKGSEVQLDAELNHSWVAGRSNAAESRSA
jgi:hypothetical protein